MEKTFESALAAVRCTKIPTGTEGGDQEPPTLLDLALLGARQKHIPDHVVHILAKEVVNAIFKKARNVDFGMIDAAIKASENHGKENYVAIYQAMIDSILIDGWNIPAPDRD